MTDRPIAQMELPESCMGFILKSGETFFIHKDDIKNIAGQIIIEGSMRKAIVIVRDKDNSIEKANMLYNILRNEKDMKPELRNKYLKQIGELLSGDSRELIDCSNNRHIEITDSQDQLAAPVIEK